MAKRDYKKMPGGKVETKEAVPDSQPTAADKLEILWQERLTRMKIEEEASALAEQVFNILGGSHGTN